MIKTTIDDYVETLMEENCPPWDYYPTLGSPTDEQEYGVVINAICSEQFQ